MSNRIISLLICIVLIFSMLPAAAASESDSAVTSSSNVVSGSVSSGGGGDTAEKKSPTYYSDEKINNARENIAKYSWAKSVKDAAVRKADAYVDHTDAYYNAVVAEGIPRSARVGMFGDQYAYYCRYCGVDLAEMYGTDPWVINAVTRPWKVQCPYCKRLFPSNDFGSFYELGLDEYGVFNREVAYEKNQELVDAGNPGYLVNELYPERHDTVNIGNGLRGSESVERWGVDDGFGYDTGVTYENGVKEVHTYVPHYLYKAWGQIGAAVSALSEAYVYTGDIKYGRAGAIILDRIADVYPGLDTMKYYDVKNRYCLSDAGTGYGKIQGRYNDVSLSKNLAIAYDAFFPAYDDPMVVEYLSGKAELYALENDKSTPDSIRANAEKGILREIFNAAKTGRIYGNFGTHQETVATAALVLDNDTDSVEMVNWIYAANTGNTKDNIAGGDFFTTLVNDVDRDGMGNEVAPAYNWIWNKNMLGAAKAIEQISNSSSRLFEHPKYVKMFAANLPLVLAKSHTAQIGDSGSTAGVAIVGDTAVLTEAFKNLRGSTEGNKIAQYIYLLNGSTADGLCYDIFAKNPTSLEDEVQQVIDEFGELHSESEMMPAYGFSVLRGGETDSNLRDVWMYFGKNGGHGHYDALNLGMEAFGLNVAPDLGYPAVPGRNPERNEWTMATISHNTVVVDGKDQESNEISAVPLHFDDVGNVKLMDVSADNVYSQTESYRRTVVTVDAFDGDAYAIDFFRVSGGNNHTYSFHSQSNEISEIEGLDMTEQKDESGNWVGTYAGADVPLGQDPAWTGSVNYTPIYPRGYTWLSEVRRDTSPENTFSIDFKVSDFRKVLKDSEGIHLRLTQLNDFAPNEVALTKGIAPRSSANAAIRPLEYLLVQREGENLDSLFTTVLEPYKNTRYIKTIAPVEMTVRDGSENAGDAARAVKVELVNGRSDYIFYATNNTVTYAVTDGDMEFSFRGFVGVFSVNESGENIFRYVNDGDIIGEETGSVPSYSGIVRDFEKGLSHENTITVELDNCRAPWELKGRYVYIENDSAENAVYKIESVSQKGDTEYVLEIGNTTLIRSYADSSNLNAGYEYNIAEGQSVYIPMTYVEENAPVFYPVDENLSATVGKRTTVNIRAESPVEAKIAYNAVILPQGASLNSETGVISWKPTESQCGENQFAITAVDDSGRESTIYFTVKVKPESKLAYVVSATQEYSSSVGGYYAKLKLINENGLFEATTIPAVTDFDGKYVLSGGYTGECEDFPRGSFVRYTTNSAGNIDMLDSSGSGLHDIGTYYNADCLQGFFLVNVINEHNGVLRFFNTDRYIHTENEAVYSCEYHEDGYSIIGIGNDEYTGETLSTIPDSIKELPWEQGNAIIEVENGKIVRVFSFTDGSYTYGSGVVSPGSDEYVNIEDISIDEEFGFDYTVVTYLNNTSGAVVLSGIGAVSLEEVTFIGDIGYGDSVVYYIEDSKLVIEATETVQGAIESFTDDGGAVIGGKAYYAWLGFEYEWGSLFDYYLNNKIAMGAGTKYHVYGDKILDIEPVGDVGSAADYAVILQSSYDAAADSAYVKLGFADNTEGTYEIGKTYLKNSSEPLSDENEMNRPKDFANNGHFGIVVKYSILHDGTLDLSAQDFAEILYYGNSATKYYNWAYDASVTDGKLSIDGDTYYGYDEDAVVFALYGNPYHYIDGDTVVSDATGYDYSPVKAKAYKLSELASMTGGVVPNLRISWYAVNDIVASIVFSSNTASNKYVVAAAMTVGETIADAGISYNIKSELAYVVEAHQSYNVKTDRYYATLTLIGENGLVKLKSVDDVVDFGDESVLVDGYIGCISDPDSENCIFPQGSFVRYALNDEGLAERIDSNGCGLHDIGASIDGTPEKGFYRVNILSMRDGELRFVNTDSEISDISTVAPVTQTYNEDICKIIGISEGVYIGEELDTLPADAVNIPANTGNAIIELDEGEIVRIFSFNDDGNTLGDVSGDAGVDINDAVRLFQYSMLPDMYPVEYTWNLDFNRDGAVDIKDAVRLFQYSMLPDMYPIV